MRRIVLWLLSTLTAWCCCFGYHTSTAGHAGRGSAPAGPAGVRHASAAGTPRRRPTRAPSERRDRHRHRRRRADPVGAGAGRSSPSRTARSPRSTSLQYPSGNGKDERDQRLRAADPDPGDARRAERATSTWSAARPSPATATSSRCRARSTRPGCEHAGDRRAPATGAPRRARDGHADQPRAARPARRRRSRAAAAWAEALADAARGRPGVQHLPRRLRASPGSAAARSTLGGLPARGGRGARARRAGRARVRRRLRRPPAGADGAAGARPQRRGQGLGGRARRARTSRPRRTPTSACPPAATWSAGSLDPATGPWRIGIEDPHDPTPGARRRPRARRRRRHLGLRAPRRPHRRRPHRRPPDGVASVTVVGPTT